MNMSEFLKPVTLIALAVGLTTGGIIVFTLSNRGGDESIVLSYEDKPLYWVAPMDPNYRREKPGKSPMGMDLIPVYENKKSENDAGPGTITIEPHVVNNLGVRVATVEKKALEEKILTVGYVKFDENNLIHIHPRVSGWVDKLYVKATGDPVSAGQPLYSLYSPELVNAQEELILALNRGSSFLIKAAENRLKALQIPLSFIEKLRKNKSVEQSIVFYSPQGGVIDNLNIREGFYVQPGTTLFSIGALDKVWVEAEVFESQAALVKKGDRVTMNLDYLPGTKWAGNVDYIYPTLDSKTRTMRLRLKFDNAEKKLVPNMFAQVVIHSESNEDLLLIPREALIQTGNQDRVVLALGEGSFKSIEVTTGREDQENVEILAGLNEGDEVVSSAQFLLDSESSKTSDFMRMGSKRAAEQDKSESVWVVAVIDEQILDERIVSASHEAIEAWNMVSMTMNFSVSDEVDFNVLTPGTKLHMEIKMGNSGMYEIIGTHRISAELIQSEENKSSAEGSSHATHDEMDHSKMDRPNHQQHSGDGK